MIRKIFLLCSFMLLASAELFAANLPNVVILATGGTIAGTHSGKNAIVGYTAASLPVEDLLRAVPDIHNIANVRGEQVFQIASENQDLEHWFKLVESVRREIARKDVDGVVITHGTDTLEETAYFLNLTVKTSKPVVLVGAMRPATSYSADGPLNLLDAVTVAASPLARGQGVLITMNGSICSARDVRKANTVRPDAFSQGIFGQLGTVIGSSVEFAQKSLKRHTEDSEFTGLQGSSLPRVDIVYCYGGTPRDMLESSVAKGARGLVIACVGDGSLSGHLRPYVKELAGNGLPVVRASRIADGPVVRNGEVNDNEYGTIPSGTLSPQKARILLALCLMRDMRIEEISRAFTQY